MSDRQHRNSSTNGLSCVSVLQRGVYISYSIPVGLSASRVVECRGQQQSTSFCVQSNARVYYFSIRTCYTQNHATPTTNYLDCK